MPEIGALQPYGLRGETGYDPRAFNYGPAPRIEPVTTGASAILGSAASLKAVSDTLAKLPALVTESYKKGQLQTEQNIAHQLKLGALAGGLDDTMKIGADNSVTLNPEDPLDKEAKRQLMAARAAALMANANRPRGALAKPNPYDAMWGTDGVAPASLDAASGAGLPGVNDPPRTTPFTGPIIPAETPPQINPPPIDPSSPPQNATAAPQGALSGGNTTPMAVAYGPVGALAGGAADTMLQSAATERRAAAILPPLPDDAGALSSATPTQSDYGATHIIKPTAYGQPYRKVRDVDGVTVEEMAPDGKWRKTVLPPKTSATAEDAANKAATVTTARELALRGHTPQQIATMTDAEKQAALAQPKTSAVRQPTAQQYSTVQKYGLDVDLKGKDAAAAASAIKDAMDKKGYELAPEQLKQYNTMVAQMARNPILKTAGTANIGYESVMAGYKKKNGFGDLAMVDGLLRLVNPSMGVTGHAADSVQQGIPTIERLTGLAVDKIFNGDQLTDGARDRIVELAKDLRERENTKRKTAIDAYLHQAKMDGLTPDQVDRAEKDALAMFAIDDPNQPAAIKLGAPGTVTMTKGGKAFVFPADKQEAAKAAGFTPVQ